MWLLRACRWLANGCRRGLAFGRLCEDCLKFGGVGGAGAAGAGAPLGGGGGVAVHP
jgi:hypothetical protein